jgi:hypothetical protein
MTRRKIGSILAGVACLGFLATAWLHSTGYSSVTELAADVPSRLGAVMPALWLMFSFDLVILGLIVGVVAYRPSATARAILWIAALAPLAAAGLQLRFLGFIPPTAILITLGALTLAAGALLGSQPQEPAV